MNKKHTINLSILLLLYFGVNLFLPAEAKKPHRHDSQQELNHSDFYLTHTQKSNLVSLLRGGDRANSILTPSLRIEINDQANFLPPGIQKKLAKGKSLPPGIAKKVVLPKTVNSHLNLSSDNSVVAIGSSVVIVNPQNIILDILNGVL
ncbi:MAG: hypothetical protein RLZZ04_121 [Cyanobacteriota bacterium]|jgi:hypothetical protein